MTRMLNPHSATLASSAMRSIVSRMAPNAGRSPGACCQQRTISSRRPSGHSLALGSVGRGSKLVMTPMTTCAGETLLNGSSRVMSSKRSMPYE